MIITDNVQLLLPRGHLPKTAAMTFTHCSLPPNFKRDGGKHLTNARWTCPPLVAGIYYRSPPWPRNSLLKIEAFSRWRAAYMFCRCLNGASYLCGSVAVDALCRLCGRLEDSSEVKISWIWREQLRSGGPRSIAKFHAVLIK